MSELSTFIIIEDGRAFAPVTIRSKELLVGRARQCALQLNDPKIPLALAGIKEMAGRFYFLPLRFSHFSDAKRPAIILNGRQLVGDTALASGDILTIEGCRLVVDRDAEALVLRVSYSDQQMATEPIPSVTEGPLTASAREDGAENSSADRPGSQAAHDVLGQWIKRRLWKGRQKVSRPTYLEPNLPQPKAGTEYNWVPTRDLVPPWPTGFLVSSLLVVGAIALLAFVVWPSTFAPGKISSAHAKSHLSLSPAIASNLNSGSCLNCHTLKATIDENCAHCHQSAGFRASISIAHKAAGLTCISCHTEHLGSDFSPKAEALNSCVTCHSDKNKETYNGKTLHTPHGGTLGYPTSGGQWVWTGLDNEALELKPEVSAAWVASYDQQTWSRVQFHAIHLYRVKAPPGIIGIKDGTLSCSSCHKDFGDKFDRETPRQVCATCHNGFVEGRTGRSLVAADKPNCTSCHVQHYYDSYRWGDLLTESAKDKRQHASDKSYLDAVRRSALPK
jgi:hypothetical protein